MEVLEPITVNEGGQDFKRIRPNNGKLMYGAMVNPFSEHPNYIIAWTATDEGAIPSIDGPIIMNGFATYEEDGRDFFESEIDKRGWIRPEDQI